MSGAVEIALMRHFETDWNAEGRLQGRADRPLTTAAVERLATLAMPPPWNEARLIASPLSRAAATAAALADGRAVATDARLVEQDWGGWEGRRAADLVAEAASGFVPTHLLGPEDRPPGGETAREALDRARRALAEIAADGRRAVLVMHKGLMRALMREVPGMTDPEIKRARLYPARISRDGRLSAVLEPVRLVPRPEQSA